MNIINTALTLLALGLSVSTRADQHAADTHRAYSKQGDQQLRRFGQAAKTGVGQAHSDVPVISRPRYFNHKNWIQQIRWDAQTGFINEFAFALPLKDAQDFRAVEGTQNTDSGWVQVASEGSRYEFSVRQIDKIYFRVQRRLLMPHFDIRLNLLDSRRLEFFSGERCVYQFHLPENLAGEIIGFKMRGTRLIVDTSNLRRDSFALRSNDADDGISLEQLRHGQEILDLVDLRADAVTFKPDCQNQLKP